MNLTTSKCRKQAQLTVSNYISIMFSNQLKNIVTKLSIVCIYRIIQGERDVRVGSDMGSDQVAQVFICFCLEKLQGWRLNNISGKGVPLLNCRQGDFHLSYSLFLSYFILCTMESPAPSSHRCWGRWWVLF